jgi:diguanylate cyclase (GGDEF)-like protein
MIKVYIAKGPETGRFFALKDKVALIGRGSDNSIRIDEKSVSRVHVKVVRENAKYYIEDLKSRNGTWVNGNAIDAGRRVEVQQGIPVALGNVLISLGKKCPLDRLPNQYSINIAPPRNKIRELPSFVDQRKRQKGDLELMYNVCMALMKTLDVKEICETVLECVSSCLKRIDSGHILLAQRGTQELKEIAARSRKTTGNGCLKYSTTLAKHVFFGGKAIMMPDTGLEDKDSLSDSMEHIGIKSVICVPLISKLGTKGVLYLQSVSVAHGFRKGDLMLLSGISTPVALAIDNAELYYESQQAKESLKRAHDDLEVEVKKRTAELVKAKNRLQELSTTDELTGLYNYRYMIFSLESELERTLRYKRKLSLMMMDIDYFKSLNDTYGHQCGNVVIKTVAQLLKRNVRRTDIVARYGGDELSIILTETDSERSLEVAEKLKGVINGYPFKWQGKALDVRVSIGLATVPETGIDSAYDLVNAADRALYEAKEQGRDSIVSFSRREQDT